MLAGGVSLSVKLSEVLSTQTNSDMRKSRQPERGEVRGDDAGVKGQTRVVRLECLHYPGLQLETTDNYRTTRTFNHLYPTRGQLNDTLVRLL